MIRASRLARCCCLVKLLVLDELVFILDAILSIYIVYAPILVGVPLEAAHRNICHYGHVELGRRLRKPCIDANWGCGAAKMRLKESFSELEAWRLGISRLTWAAVMLEVLTFKVDWHKFRSAEALADPSKFGT
jgi:hypothetical protein